MSEYSKDLEIDFDNLEINLRDQPTNYIKWAEKWANSVAVRDRKKEATEVLKAELYTKYKSLLTPKGGKKPTEAEISSAIQDSTDFKQAQQELIDATEQMNVFASAKTAFEHRKKALENLAQLWISGYWSDPKVPQKARDKFEKDTSGYKEAQIKKLNTNKRLQKRKVKK